MVTNNHFLHRRFHLSTAGNNRATTIYLFLCPWHIHATIVL